MAEDRNQPSLFGDADYEAFTEKFKPKKTTDDCYTPPEVYDALADWVAEEYGLDRQSFVRPFYPEMDYTEYEYPEGCTVVDNPPFSLLAAIIRHYCRNGIRFFLFAPALTLFTATECPICYLGTGSDITYENGAVVATSFVTNLDRYRLRTAPQLHARLKEANARALAARRQNKPELPKYVYPDCVISAAAMQKLSKYGAELNISPEDAIYTGSLDAQRPFKKSIFGGGFLLRERAAAERAAARRWELSDRERALLDPERRQTGGLFDICP